MQTNGLDELSMSLHGHKHLMDLCQTNGLDQLSMSSMDTSTLMINAKPMGAISYQYPPTTQLATINSKPMDMILTVISTESLYKLMYLRFICYKLKLIEVITISTWLRQSCYVLQHN